MDAGVGQQVGDHLGELMGVAERLHHVERLPGTGSARAATGRQRGQPHVPPRVCDDDGTDPVGRQREQVHGLPVRHGGVTQLGEQEEVVDETAHPLRVPGDQLMGLAPARRREARMLHEQFREPLDGGERCAQFMARVGHEPAQPLLRRVLAVQRGPHLAEHRVEGDPEPSGLRARIGVRDAQVRFTTGDAQRRALHPVQGAQPQAYRRAPQQSDADGGHDTDGEADPQEFGRGSFDGVQGKRDDDAQSVGARSGDHPPVRRAAAGGNGGGPSVLEGEGGNDGGEQRAAVPVAQRIRPEPPVGAVEVDPVVGGQGVLAGEPFRPLGRTAGGRGGECAGRRAEMREAVVDLAGEPGAHDRQPGGLGGQHGDRGQHRGDQHQAGAHRTRPQPEDHGASSRGSRRQ